MERTGFVMLGAVIGDIVGSVYEFHNIKSKDFPLFGSRCRPTDDSIMTLAIAQALMKSRTDGYHSLRKNAVECMQELGRRYPNCGFGGMFRRWLGSHSPKPYQSFGNGAAMRVSPVAHVAKTLEECNDLSRMVTSVTHNHPEGIKGGQAAAAAVWMALHQRTKEEIREAMETDYYRLDFTLDEIRPAYRFDVTCQGSVPQAIEAFLESTDFEDAIRCAVSIGGDSDTIAAITGAIAGAFYGIPPEIAEQAYSRLDTFQRSLLDQFEGFIAAC